MKYSIVIPVYNSQDSLDELHRRIVASISKITADFELIFVDDYSTDASWEKLLKIKTENKNQVKIISFSKNYGQHNATFCGLRHTTGDRIITIDDDLQQAPEDIHLLIERMDETNADLVYGVGGSKHSTIRKIGSNLYKKGSKHIDGKLGNGSSFRLMNATLLKRIINHKQHFIFIEELLFWHTDCIEIVAVSHAQRKNGKSGYSPLKIFKLVVGASINYSNWPLKMMTYGGAVLSFFSFLLGLFFIYKKIFLHTKNQGFTALIVTIFFSTSILLLCFGIVGKYLHNIYLVLNNKPVYSIKKAML